MTHRILILGTTNVEDSVLQV